MKRAATGLHDTRTGQNMKDEDAAKAYDAVWAFVASAEQALPLLRKRLRPVPRPDTKIVTRLIADLDSDNFDVRQHAMKELSKLGDVVIPDALYSWRWSRRAPFTPTSRKTTSPRSAFWKNAGSRFASARQRPSTRQATELRNLFSNSVKAKMVKFTDRGSWRVWLVFASARR
jgi:hypothetical protein